MFPIGSSAESREHALKLGRDRGLLYVNGYDHPHILAGQGTMGLEIMEQVPDVEAVIIPAGGKWEPRIDFFTLGLNFKASVPSPHAQSQISIFNLNLGGGGLIAGSALAIKSMKPNVLIYGAESTKCASFTAALKAGHPVYTKAGSSLADGLAVPMVRKMVRGCGAGKG